MRRHTVRSRILLAAALLLGCGSTMSPPGGSPDAGEGGVAPASATSWPGEVYENGYGPDGKTVPIVNAEICVLDHPEISCVRSDVDGKYALTVPHFPPSAVVAVVLEAEGHLGTVRPAGEGWWPGGTFLRSDQGAAALFGKAGFTYPARGTGFVSFRLFQGGVAQGAVGATVTLTPPSAKGPIYLSPAGEPDPALTAVSANGGVLFGNVPPGPVTLTVKAEGKVCEAKGVSGIWLSSGPNTITVPVVADADTYDVPLFCLP